MTMSGPLLTPAAKHGRISFVSTCAANNKPAVAGTNSNTWTEVKCIHSIWPVTKPLVHLAITDYFPFVMDYSRSVRIAAEHEKAFSFVWLRLQTGREEDRQRQPTKFTTKQ